MIKELLRIPNCREAYEFRTRVLPPAHALRAPFYIHSFRCRLGGASDVTSQISYLVYDWIRFRLRGRARRLFLMGEHSQSSEKT